uniref:SCP domain-containing protein n=1 Tax=Romanomermis culicivorax TaxID=13658 RepID=A0A915HV63_ROMCU
MQYSYSPIPRAEDDGEPKTGHYTQLIWARTQKIGCAIAANCLKNGVHYDMMLLCNYSPTIGCRQFTRDNM